MTRNIQPCRARRLPSAAVLASGASLLAALGTERVLAVRHWTDTQFTFTTTRDSGLRFQNGQFVMLGLSVDSSPMLRAYSIASANHEDHLQFLSIKVPDGPLTSRLQHVRAGDAVLVSRKPTETLRSHELLGEEVRAKLRYYPTVTREPYVNRGRLTALIESGRLFRDLALPPLDPGADRLMVCGSPAMLSDTCALLAAHGFSISPHIGEPGDYVIERAFVTR